MTASGNETFRTYIATFLGTVVAMYAFLYAALVFIDPYGTGRLTPIQRTDIATEDNNLANAARIRDPRFNAAIIGNSRSMRLAPTQLNQASLSFVMLAMPGLDPLTQITVAEAFLRHHRERELTLIWGLGDEWCRSHHDSIPFPRWLYETSDLQYLANLLSFRSIRLAWRRARILLGFATERGTKDGYEPDHPFWRKETDISALLSLTPPTTAEPLDSPMPLLDELETTIRRLDYRRVRLLLVFQPVFVNVLPEKESDAETRWKDCTRAVSKIAGLVPNARMLDLRTDTKLTRDPSNFLDGAHYRDNVAREVERTIISMLAEP